MVKPASKKIRVHPDFAQLVEAQRKQLKKSSAFVTKQMQLNMKRKYF